MSLTNSSVKSVEEIEYLTIFILFRSLIRGKIFFFIIFCNFFCHNLCKI